MTTYLLAVYDDGSEPYPDDDLQTVYAEVEAFNDQLKADGSWVFAAGLEPFATSTSVVDATGGDVIITDGPFAEAKEHIGGFWIVNVPDLDAAMKLAAEGSVACRQPVEVRPFQDDTEC